MKNKDMVHSLSTVMLANFILNSSSAVFLNYLGRHNLAQWLEKPKDERYWEWLERTYNG